MKGTTDTMLSIIYGTAYLADGADEDSQNIRVYRFDNLTGTIVGGGPNPMAGRAYIGHDTAEIAHTHDDHAELSIPDEYLPLGEGRYASIHPFTDHGRESVRTVDVVEFDPGDDPYILCDYCGEVLLRDDEKFEAMFGHPIGK